MSSCRDVVSLSPVGVMKSWFANRRPRLPYQKQIRLFLVPYLLGSRVLFFPISAFELSRNLAEKLVI